MAEMVVGTGENCTVIPRPGHSATRGRCCPITIWHSRRGMGRTLQSPRADARCSSLQEHPGHFHKCKASGSFLSPGLEESGKSGHCGFQKTLPEVCRIMAASGPVTAWGPGQVSFDTRASAEGLPEAAWLPEAGPARCLWARVPTPVPWARP